MTIIFVFVAWILSQPPAALNGAVINADTKAPIAGARVLLAKTDGRLADAILTSTDDRGRFALAAIPPGTYRLVAEQDDYLRGEPSPPITLTAGEPAPSVIVALTATAVISGRVTDEFGEPAAKIYVRALTTRVEAEVRTNDLGEYRLFGLAPGAYVVSAERYKGPTIEAGRLLIPTPPCPDCMGEGTAFPALARIFATGDYIDPRALTGQTYPVVFFPGTTDRAAAASVKAAAGARVEGIDLRLVLRQ